MQDNLVFLGIHFGLSKRERVPTVCTLLDRNPYSQCMLSRFSQREDLVCDKVPSVVADVYPQA